jgi:hypothetical protein
VLGSIYIEYQCVLMKPTIQPNFVGTSDLFEHVNTGSATAIAVAATTFNLIDDFYASDIELTPDRRNNAGSYVGDNLISNEHALAVPEGLWNVRFRMDVTCAATTVGLFTVAAATTVGGSSNAANVNDGLSPSGIITPGSTIPFSYDYNSVSAITVAQGFNLGFQMLVPSAQYRYLTFGFTRSTGSITCANPSISLTAAWPNAVQTALLNPSANLSERLRVLEHREALSINTVEEKKDTPAQSVTTNSTGFVDGDYVVYPPGVLPTCSPVLSRSSGVSPASRHPRKI